MESSYCLFHDAVSTSNFTLHTTGNSVSRLIKNYNKQRISKEALAGVELYPVIFLQMLS
jgi:hypothetical protein